VLDCVLAQRAGFSIDWAATNKSNYHIALTKELEDPHKGHLDELPKAAHHKRQSHQTRSRRTLRLRWAWIARAKTDDPELKARYQAQELKRKQR
jgi:cell filamentation protein